MKWIEDWNRCEAVLWFAFALFCAAKAVWPRIKQRSVFAALAVTFVVFGISDLIEAETGAWWLAVLKGACLAVFVIAVRKLRKKDRPR